MANQERLLGMGVIGKSAFRQQEPRDMTWVDDVIADDHIPLPPDQLDRQPKQVVWGSQGSIRHVASLEIDSVAMRMSLTKPVRTKFVAVRSENQVDLVPYDSAVHGEWQDIELRQISPAQICKLNEDYEGGLKRDQTRKVRKSGASVTAFPPHGGVGYTITKKVS